MADDRAYRVTLTWDADVGRFVAAVPELEVEAAGATRAEALESLESAVEVRVERAAVDGETLPPAVDAEPAPLDLRLKLAPGVARELRFRAHRAGMTVEALAQQIVAQSLGPGAGARRSPPAPQPEPAEPTEPTEAPTKASSPPKRKGRRRRSEGYRPDIDDQANFLAYVRDMEKGGGRRR